MILHTAICIFFLAFGGLLRCGAKQQQQKTKQSKTELFLPHLLDRAAEHDAIACALLAAPSAVICGPLDPYSVRN